MKTSNKILIVLYSSLTLIFCVAMMDIRINGNHMNETVEKRSEKLLVGEIAYLKLQGIKGNVVVIPGDENAIEFQAEVGSQLPTISHIISGNSLILTDANFNRSSKYSLIRIHLKSENIKLYSFENSNVRINSNEKTGLNLNLNLDASTINMWTSPNMKIDKIILNATDKSVFNMHQSFQLDTLDIKLSQSKINSRSGSKVSFISGFAENSSRINIGKGLEYQLKLDESSELN